MREIAGKLGVEQLAPYGHGYCYLNLLTVFGECHSPEQVSALATESMRRHLLSGEEFHACCLAARGQRRWDGEMQSLFSAIQFTPRAESIVKELLTAGSFIACGFHWGAFRFIPFGVTSLGFSVKALFGGPASSKYGAYFEFTDAEIEEMGARGVPESFWKVSVIGTHRESDLLKALKSLKSKPAALFIPVDGMFTSTPSHNTAEISFAGMPLRVKANPATLAAALDLPLVSLFAKRQDSGTTLIEVADVIRPNATAFGARTAMQQMYRSLEDRARLCPEDWEGARTFHHLRIRPLPKQATRPTPEDLSIVRSIVERGGLSLNTSRVVRVEIPGGVPMWVDGRDLRCFGGTPETLRTLDALRTPDALARLWREAQGDTEQGQSLIRFLGQLHADGLLKHSPSLAA
jgi:hypothetical protein